MENNDDFDILASNDLDFFEEELMIVNRYENKTIHFHTFQNPNINLLKMKVNLIHYLQTIENDIHLGSIYNSIKVAALYDSKKYKNMEIIPKLSRKQKAYNQYLKKVRPCFDKLKKEHSKNEFSIEFSHQDVLKNTIPEYLETCKNYYFVFLQNSINQFKLSLLYGYIIILGYENNAMNVVGFDEKNFLLRKVDNEIMHVDHDTLVQNCFDPCVLYSLSGCDREINLGFVR
tara:strand:- start:173 stop:865 length:693 start_codon:yes stop_codon:yes gene_type:complete